MYVPYIHHVELTQFLIEFFRMLEYTSDGLALELVYCCIVVSGAIPSAEEVYSHIFEDDGEKAAIIEHCMLILTHRTLNVTEALFSRFTCFVVVRRGIGKI